MLDVTKPLRCFQKIKDKIGKELMVDFPYECLPFFCFACGIIDHSEKDCQYVTEENNLKHEKLRWSLTLKTNSKEGENEGGGKGNQGRLCFRKMIIPRSLVLVVLNTWL